MAEIESEESMPIQWFRKPRLIDEGKYGFTVIAELPYPYKYVETDENRDEVITVPISIISATGKTKEQAKEKFDQALKNINLKEE